MGMMLSSSIYGKGGGGGFIIGKYIWRGRGRGFEGELGLRKMIKENEFTVWILVWILTMRR